MTEHFRWRWPQRSTAATGVKRLVCPTPKRSRMKPKPRQPIVLVLVLVLSVLIMSLAWNEDAVEADQRASQALALDEEVQERAPDLTVAPPPMPVARRRQWVTPEGEPGPSRSRQRQPERRTRGTPGSSSRFEYGRRPLGARRGFWEAFGDEGQLAWREDVAREEGGHGRAPRTRGLHPFSPHKL
jgi:hypothetical protein